MTTSVQADDPLVGRLLDGRYRLTRRLARGGMATVYTGLDERLDRAVAVKVMHRGLTDDPDFVARFTREARSAARLSAPEVVAVYDQGTDTQTGAAYLVMEHVDGRDLRALLRERGALPPDRALSVLEPVLRALAAAHRAGIVHRDVKPENVLLGDDGRIKVADFGLAKAVETSELTTNTGLLIGTVAYLAPEQIDRGSADARTDVYAAGIVLWEMLAGYPPFTAETPMAVAFQHVNADVPPPSAVVSGVPPALDDLVVRATRRDPEQRPQDAGAFLAEVRELRQAGQGRDRVHDTLTLPRPPRVDDPRTAPAPTPARRAPRRRRRRRALLALVLVLAVLAGAGGWYLGAGRYTTAPSLLGRPAGDAEALLRAQGLDDEPQPARFHETVPAGQVLDQDPDPGGRVRKGGQVAVVLSLGPDRREVPTLAGSTRDAAAGALEERGLRVGRVTEAFSSAPTGTVVSSDPTAGQALRPDAAVDLVLSKGVELLPVVSVTGQQRAAASAALTEAGFAVTVTEAFDEQVPTGQVIGQAPAGGTAPRGSSIDLVVSKGPDLQVVPPLVGRSRAEAESALQALGLKARVIAIPGPGRVRSSDPGAGATVRKGTTVTLYVF